MRCSATTELTQAAWKTPADEPMWFYDLHPVARELVQDHGDAPLVVAHGLLSSGFSDVAEMELVKNGKPVAESDLIVHTGGRLYTGEVKTSNELHHVKAERRRAAQKRVLWADVVLADDILLATTQPEWAPSSVNALTDVMRNHMWAPGHRPRLTLLTELGGTNPKEVEVDW